MSDSTQNLDQVSQSAIQRETTINALLDAASPSTIFGRRSSTSSGLVFGYYGGRFGGTSIANGTVTATNSATNYFVADKATLTPSISTSNTNWNDTTNYWRLYLLTASGGAITAYEDHRAGGIIGGGGGAATTAGIEINAQTGTSYTVLSGDLGKLVTFSNASSIAVTLPQATGSFTAPFFFYAKNLSAGVVTITPTTSTINGAATLVLRRGQSALIVSDGTNYQAAFLPESISVDVAFSATLTIDLSAYPYNVVFARVGALTNNITVNVTNGVRDQVLHLILPQDGTGNRTFTAGANVAYSATITGVTLSTSASKEDELLFRWDATVSKARVLAVNYGF